jgi:predicted Zn-dependent peptidase
VIPSDRSQAYFSIALPAFPFVDQDRYPLFVLSSILGGGLRSRLFRERRGMVYSIGSEIHAYRNGGMLCIEGAAAPEQLMTVISTTVHQLFGMLCGELPIDEEELVCTRMILRGQHLLAAEHLNTSMSRLATQEFYFGQALPEGEIVQRFESIQSADLERVSGRLLPGLDDLAIAVTGPETWASEWDATLNDLVEGFAELRSSNS